MHIQTMQQTTLMSQQVVLSAHLANLISMAMLEMVMSIVSLFAFRLLVLHINAVQLT